MPTATRWSTGISPPTRSTWSSAKAVCTGTRDTPCARTWRRLMARGRWRSARTTCGPHSSISRGHAHPTDHGLVPYWLFPLPNGAHIERHVPALPLSRDAYQLEALKRSLAVYRMVFGQPRQDDLMAFLLERLSAEQLGEIEPLLRIDLSPQGVE